ncbi:hypothetical protein F385_307 [Pantoea agglomerans 299R]|nr:hypothetical protein F385_307 [Pantoea agglomerans 299R]
MWWAERETKENGRLNGLPLSRRVVHRVRMGGALLNVTSGV